MPAARNPLQNTRWNDRGLKGQISQLMTQFVAGGSIQRLITFKVTNPFRKSKHFSKGTSQPIFTGLQDLYKITLVLSESKEWVVLPLFFLTLFGSHRYTILGLRSLSGRGITTAAPAARKCPHLTH